MRSRDRYYRSRRRWRSAVGGDLDAHAVGIFHEQRVVRVVEDLNRGHIEPGRGELGGYCVDSRAVGRGDAEVIEAGGVAVVGPGVRGRRLEVDGDPGGVHPDVGAAFGPADGGEQRIVEPHAGLDIGDEDDEVVEFHHGVLAELWAASLVTSESAMTVRFLALFSLAALACTPAHPPSSQALAPESPAPAATAMSPAMSPLIARIEGIGEVVPDEGAVPYLLAYLHVLALPSPDEDEPGAAAAPTAEAEAHRREAYRWLEALAASSWDLGVEARVFAPLADEPRYRELARRLTERVPEVTAGVTEVYRLGERDLIPEGVAYDPGRRALLVSSIRKRKIVRVDAVGAVSDFVAPVTAGIGEVLGLRVDGERDALWAVANPVYQGTPAEPPGRSALYRFSLADGSLEAEYPLLDEDAAHLLNDLDVADDGQVYVTDSKAGGVWRLRPGADALERFVAAETMFYPNGVALGGAEPALFVTDMLGIWRVSLDRGAARRVQPPADASLGGIDGLYWDGSGFIGVQNGFGAARLIRFELDAAGTRAVSVAILASAHPAFDIPTTAALTPSAVLLLANSQLRALDDAGQFLPAGELDETVILRVPRPR